MSDRIEELEQQGYGIASDLRSAGTDKDVQALLAYYGIVSFMDAADEVATVVSSLATIAREAEARALTWQLTTENTQKLLNEATARAAEREQKYREADERAWACESVGIPGLEARALKAEAMCEWLAERLEESDDTVLSADTWLTAAREAVIHGE